MAEQFLIFVNNAELSSNFTIHIILWSIYIFYPRCCRGCLLIVLLRQKKRNPIVAMHFAERSFFKCGCGDTPPQLSCKSWDWYRFWACNTKKNWGWLRRDTGTESPTLGKYALFPNKGKQKEKV